MLLTGTCRGGKEVGHAEVPVAKKEVATEWKGDLFYIATDVEVDERVKWLNPTGVVSYPALTGRLLLGT